MESVRPGAFHGLESLRELNLRDNLIRTIKAGAFTGALLVLWGKNEEVVMVEVFSNAVRERRK